ncbi:MAG: GerAB/ArcD/ProY family transporter [Ignavibacteriales bacterium]
MNRDTLSTNQVMSIVAQAMLGVSILTVPGVVSRIAGPDAWLSFLITWAAVSGVAAVTVSLSLRFPGETLVGYSSRILGKRLGVLVSVVFGLLETISGALVARVFAEAVGAVILVRAPIEVLSGAMVLLTLYLSLQRVRVFGRVNAFFFPGICLVFALFIAGTYGYAHLANLTPVLRRGLAPVLGGVAQSVLAFQGFEVMLYFLGFADKPRENMRASLTGISLVGGAYVATVAGVTGVFGPQHLSRLQWPVLEAIKVLGGESALGIERFEALFITVWMIAAFTTVGALVYTGVRILSEITGLQHSNLLVPLIGPLVYVTGLAPENVFSALGIASRVSVAIVLYATFISLVMYVVAVATGKRGDGGGAGTGT